MKRIKMVPSLALALIMAMTLAACGEGSGTPAANAGSATDSAPAAAAENIGTSGKVYELNMACHDPSTAGQAAVLDQWVAGLEEASGGRLKITIYYGGSLGGPRDEVNLVETGAVDLCWNATAHNPNRFNTAEALCLPMIGIENGMQGTAALLDLYEDVPEIKEEFSIFKTVAVHLNALVPISTNKKLESAPDFSGLRLRTGVPYAIQWLEQMGANGMSFAISDSYENISKNVADGLLNDWNNLNANKLYEVVDYVLDINVGAPIGFVAMNWDTYNSLPSDLQELIDGTFKELSFDLAEAFANGRIAGLDMALEYNTEVYTPSAELEASMLEAAETVKSNWLATLREAGVNGKETLQILQQKLEKYAEEYASYN